MAATHKAKKAAIKKKKAAVHHKVAAVHGTKLPTGKPKVVNAPKNLL